MSTLAKIVVTACAVMALAACSSSNPPGILSQGTSGQPANPVPLLKKAGAQQDQYSMVSNDIYGDRFADGSLQGEEVTAWTFSSSAAQEADLARNSNPADGSQCVVGTLWNISVVPVTDMNGNESFPVPLAVIAQKTGGTAQAC